MSSPCRNDSNFSIEELRRYFDKDGVLYSSQSCFVIDELIRLYSKERGDDQFRCEICGSYIITGKRIFIDGKLDPIVKEQCSRPNLHSDDIEYGIT